MRCLLSYFHFKMAVWLCFFFYFISLQELAFFKFIFECACQLLLKPFFLKAVWKWVSNNSNISVKCFCDFQVMAGSQISPVGFPPSVQRVRLILSVDGRQVSHLPALNLHCSDFLGLWEGRSLCAPSALCWHCWERGHRVFSRGF